MDVSISSIKNVSYGILSKLGVPQSDAKIIVDTIVYAHQRGKGTHGIGRILIYARKIQEGLMTAKTEFCAIKDNFAVSLYDAQHGFGQVAAYKGMEMAIKKASQYGVGVVGVRHSNNFGTAGFFVDLAANNNMIGFIFANSSPAIAPTGGNTPIFGTNPIGIGFPGGHNKPAVILDMATSNAARGKIRLAAKNGDSIPVGWAFDSYGNPTTDPIKALKGSMVPIGGHKGFGLSLIVDVIAGLLTGSAFGGDVKALNHKDEFSDYGHLMIAININSFLSYEDYLDKMDYLTNQVKQCGEKNEVFLPGEHSFKLFNSDMVTVSDKQIIEINSLATSLGIKDHL
ncbi:MAG: Ldh family oxidoreductase [Tannerellaceae bacterium]|nr:Ldh family oxidoreductase [Tannerellaceae bacterium]